MCFFQGFFWFCGLPVTHPTLIFPVDGDHCPFLLHLYSPLAGCFSLSHSQTLFASPKLGELLFLP